MCGRAAQGSLGSDNPPLTLGLISSFRQEDDSFSTGRRDRVTAVSEGGDARGCVRGAKAIRQAWVNAGTRGASVRCWRVTKGVNAWRLGTPELSESAAWGCR